MANAPRNPTGQAYPNLHDLDFPNTLQPAAQGKPQGIPITNMGNTQFPQFNKNKTGVVPTTKIIIKNLIRGNTTG